METLWQDLKHGARLLRLNPGFTIVAILSLALGVGANTAIFQLLDAVRLRTLPVKDPQQLAIVRVRNAIGPRAATMAASQITNPQWEQIRDHQEGFTSIFAWAENDFNLATTGEARYAHGMFVSGDFFKVLEVQPLIGRLISARRRSPRMRHTSRGHQLRILAARVQRRSGHHRSQDHLDGNPFPIIGVTPPGFFGVEIGRMFDVAVPICSEPMIRVEDGMLDVRHAYWLARRWAA